MTAASRWFDELKAWPVAYVAGRFGLEVVRRAADVSFPCPACAKDLRHSRGADPRKAVKVLPDNRWWCEPCSAAGDVVALAAAIVTKTPSPERDRWRDVRAACVSVGLVMGEPLERPSIAYTPPPPPSPQTVIERPPAHELATLWNACGPVSLVSSAGRYLASRGLMGQGLHGVDPMRWADVVREAPAALPAPVEWWTGAWLRRWPLVFPAYDGNGRLASIQARAIDRTAEPKTRWPYRRSASGLLFADVMGVGFLRSRADGVSVEGLDGVVIVEGATDTLKMARVVEAADATLAVLGYAAGSKHALAQLDCPLTVPFIVATDDDEVGDRYAREVRQALDWRVPVFRMRTPQGRNADGSKVADWSDCTDADVLEALETSSRWEVCHG
jgi:5S rRNA maturation endonuclease (ribonuclease M5)